MKIYRQLYLLVDEFNTIYGIIMSATKLTFVLSDAFCTYGTIRLEGMITGFLGILGMTLMIFFAAMTVTMGEVNNASKQFLRHGSKAGMHIAEGMISKLQM